MLNGSSATTSSMNSTNSYCGGVAAGGGGSLGANSQMQTIEEQIKHVDRIIKVGVAWEKNYLEIKK